MTDSEATRPVPSPELIETALDDHNSEAKRYRKLAKCWGALTLLAVGVSFGEMVDGHPVFAIAGGVVSVVAGYFYGDRMNMAEAEQHSAEGIQQTAVDQLRELTD